MKSDDLERLEESQEMQQLIHAAKEQYEQEKSVHPPVAYAAFAQNLRERQKDGKMKAKQEPPERETFEVKGGKRSGISPWWLVAACLLGGIIGYGISTTSDRQEAGLERLAVADTVIVVRERVDTVYREVEVPSFWNMLSRVGKLCRKRNLLLSLLSSCNSNKICRTRIVSVMLQTG